MLHLFSLYNKDTRNFVMQYSTKRRALSLLTVFALLQGCDPGMHMQYFGDKFDFFNQKATFKANGEIEVGNILIKPITAEYIATHSNPSLYESMPKDAVHEKTLTYYQYRLGLGAKEPSKNEYYEYRIGPRDVLNITVYEHPELSIAQGQFRQPDLSGTIVREDGTIYYPYAGIIKAAGMTREELRQDLSQNLSQYIENPQVEVSIASFRSQRVYVVGEVKYPGRIPINDVPLTALEAINRPQLQQNLSGGTFISGGAGGFTQNADRRNVVLTRDGKTYRVDLQALYEAGDLSQDILLKDGDVLNVPNNAFDIVFVMGEVKQAQAYQMQNGRMTLTEALGLAGGTDQVNANSSRVFIIRGGKGQPEVLHLDMRQPDSMLLGSEFLMQPHDVVFVDTAEVTRWNRFISQILPTATMLQTMGGTALPLYSQTPH